MSAVASAKNQPAAKDGAAAAVELRSLTLRAGDKTLLQQASASFDAGKIVLIVGPSGAGKSLLLQALAGLLDGAEQGVAVSGEIDFPQTAAAGRRASVGVVFQHFALLDELSPLDNVRLAHAHRAKKRGPQRKRGMAHFAQQIVPVLFSGDDSDDVSADGVDLPPKKLLDELGVPRGVRTAQLSGGQRQRLAIARTLAYNPDIILYDEPTSGLDPATGRQVASLIASTQQSHPKTSIIVTHDYQSLAPIADQIFLLDPHTKSLVEVQRDRWSELGRLLAPPPKENEPQAPPALEQVTGGARSAIRKLGEFFAASSRVAEQTVLAPLRLVPLWKSPAWGLRFVLHYLRLVAGPSAWLYIAVAGAIVGFVTTYFTFRFLPYAQYTEPLLIEELLMSMGFALYRILVPVLATILIAARCGAAVASDVGGKAYGRQIDALRTLGAGPKRYLLTPALYAFLIGAPILTAVGYQVAAATSLVVFTAMYPERGPDFWQLHFHRQLAASGSEWLFTGAGWLLAKTLLCAAGIALIAYHQGARPKTSTRDVSGGITSTILWSTLFVLAVHFAFAFWEF